MPGRNASFGIFLLSCFLPALAFAQSEHRTQRVTFKDGAATIVGRIKGRQSVDYVFPAGAGESLRVDLRADNSANYFNLLAPGETETAFFIGSMSAEQSYRGVAPVAGDYIARIYLVRSAARRSESSRYTLRIALGETRATDERGPDFADGLKGGPDYWEVTGVPKGDTLKVRAAPSPRAGIVTQVLNTAIMKNHGCKNTRGQRWCRVEDGAGRKGWANGKYLREAAWPPG